MDLSRTLQPNQELFKNPITLPKTLQTFFNPTKDLYTLHYLKTNLPNKGPPQPYTNPLIWPY